MRSIKKTAMSQSSSPASAGASVRPLEDRHSAAVNGSPMAAINSVRMTPKDGAPIDITGYWVSIIVAGPMSLTPQPKSSLKNALVFSLSRQPISK